MPKLSEIARVVSAGRNTDNSVESLARAVWLWMQNNASEKGIDRNGRTGSHYHGIFGRAAETLWLDKDSVEAVRRYLRETGNVICVFHQQGKTPIWWVSDTFTETQLVVRNPAHTSAERKLTPAEAGEDRAAAPVKTVYRCYECDPPKDYPSATHLGGHRSFAHTPMTCRECGYPAIGSGALMRHAQQEHPKHRAGQRYCRTCDKHVGKAVRGTPFYCEEHRTEHHKRDAARKRRQRAATGAAPQEATPQSAPLATSKAATVAARVQALIDENLRLRTEIDSLQTELAQLEQIKKALGIQ